MKKKQNNKRMLLMSIMSLLLCVTMLMGSTLAWFTDTVTSTENRIQAGNLAIDLLMDKTEDGNYVSIRNGSGDIFSEATGNGILWEPGKTEIVYLQVHNKGNLAVKYNIALAIEDTGLAGALEYAVLDGAKAADLAAASKWTDITTYPGVLVDKLPTNDVLAAPNGKLLAGNSDFFALAVHMKEDAGNEYQGKSISIDLTLVATQASVEPDSFGNQYDASALLPGEKISGEGMTTNLLSNGDFEQLNSAGQPTGWSIYSNRGSFDNGTVAVATATPQSGNNYMAFHSGNGVGPHQASLIEYWTKTSIDVDAEMTIPFSAWVYIPSTNEGFEPYFDLYVYGYNDAGSVAQQKRALIFVEGAIGGKYDQWVEVTTELPVNAATCQIDVNICVREMVNNATGAPAGYTQDGTWSGDILIDNISVTGPMSNEQALATSFRNLLAAEAAVSQKVESVHGDPYEVSAPFPGQTNRTTNPGFDNNGEGWSYPSRLNNYVSFVDDPHEAGNTVVKFDLTQTANINPYVEQYFPVVGGAEYQVSYRYMIVLNDGVTDYGRATVKTEYYTDITLPGAGSTGEAYADAKEIVADGQWHEVSVKCYPTENTQYFCPMVRALDSGKYGYTVYMDDVEVVMTMAPEAMSLDTGDVFFYNDMHGATFTASAKLDYYPELANGTVDFQVYDGATMIWEKKSVAISNGAASTYFSFSELMKEEYPYCVKAIMKYANGTEVNVQTQNIYVYSRPEYLGADGIYMKNGTEPFVPLWGDHVSRGVDPNAYTKVREAGINFIQIGTFTSAEATLDALDAAEEAGLMCYLCLYRNMVPAGHADNIDLTTAILSDSRVVNHPALFGYLVMDEVYLNLTNPEEDMENSYRLIRMFDDKHPIMALEAVSNYYGKTEQFCDALMIDPYSSAENQSATKYTKAAIEAVDGKKPVYVLLEAYYTTHGRYPTGNDLRNNNYQALIAGADCIGYYSITDSWYTQSTGKWDTPVWNAGDGGELWNAMIEFGTKEWEIAIDHFIFENSPTFVQGLADDGTYRYYSWIKDGEIYMVVLGLKEANVDVAVSIALTNGDMTVGAYTSEIIAGSDAEAPTGNGTLDVTINGVEAILYKITPSA